MITGPRSIMPKLKLFYAVLVVAGLGFALVSPAAADYRTGLLAAKKQDYATAFREFRTLALKGHAPSQFNIALMYHHGRGVPQDYDKARQWYTLSAERGHISAMNNLGSMYRRGEGIARNYERAGFWYAKAAHKSNTAKANLAYLHRYGLGVKKSNALAFKFYKEGAEAVSARDAKAAR